MHNKLHISASIFGALLLIAPLAGADDAPVRMNMVFSGKANLKPISVYGLNTDTGKNRLIAMCRKKCELDVPAGNKVFILFPGRNKKYKTYIRREQKQAELRDGVYYFDLAYGAPKDEERNYFRAYAQDKMTPTQDKICRDFDASQLSERPKSCHKVKPSLPPRMRRSGWCKLEMTVLTNGRTQDVATTACSEDIFKISSEEAVKLYRYYPKLKDGQAASSRLTTTVNFTLRNGQGKIIPPKVKK